MNRIITGALLSVALAGAAFAASAPPTTTTTKPVVVAPAAAAPAAPVVTTPAPTPDFAAQCKSLGAQWKTAADAHKTDKTFAQAKSGATKAERNCKSTKAATEKKGVTQYEAALKLLGVTATP